MSRTTNLTQNPLRPIYSQIMRRITPVIVIAFVLFSAVVVYIFFSSIRAQLDQVHQVEMAERSY